MDYLDADGLEGARIGVFRRYLRPDSTHPDIVANTEQAVADMRAAGAEIVDPFTIPGINLYDGSIWCEVFQHDVNIYLASRGPEAPVKTLAEVLASGKFDPSIEGGLRSSIEWDQPPCPDLYAHEPNIAFRSAVIAAMEEAELDAIVYPTWSWPARKIGDMASPAGDNSQMLSPQSGLPAIQVPSGFTVDGLPTGITFVGALFGEPELIRIAYAYEQATRKRRAPKAFGPLDE
jgi:Asp-tRNA(Asn)/Glu-tRNA(Gln) amidotransferase A subunit family amidase